MPRLVGGTQAESSNQGREFGGWGAAEYQGLGFQVVVLRRKIHFTEPNSAVLQQNGSSQDWAIVLVLSYTSPQRFGGEQLQLFQKPK